MLTAKEIRSMIGDFVAERIDLDDFEDRIVQGTWTIRNAGDQEARSLAADVELRLAEYSAGHLPIEQMRAELATIADGLPVVNIRFQNTAMHAAYSIKTGTAISPSTVPEPGMVVGLIGKGRALEYA